MNIRPITATDREPLATLLRRIESFNAEEVDCALELIDLAKTGDHREYQVLVAEKEGTLAGYVCYGPTPMTEGTYDLYWIASDPKFRGQGAGAALVAAMEGELRRRGARQIRIETSATEDYGPARGFYRAMKYSEEARFRDFYKVGDDLIILRKTL
jgi:ribosomal protein S18 acetylase RimI-like enzyme